jgi:hypothetical protein
VSAAWEKFKELGNTKLHLWGRLSSLPGQRFGSSRIWQSKKSDHQKENVPIKLVWESSGMLKTHMHGK